MDFVAQPAIINDSVLVSFTVRYKNVQANVKFKNIQIRAQNYMM